MWDNFKRTISCYSICGPDEFMYRQSFCWCEQNIPIFMDTSKSISCTLTATDRRIKPNLMNGYHLSNDMVSLKHISGLRHSNEQETEERLECAVWQLRSTLADVRRTETEMVVLTAMVTWTASLRDPRNEFGLNRSNCLDMRGTGDGYRSVRMR